MDETQKSFAFRIAYHHDRGDEHSIDARALARSLNGLADAFAVANSTYNGPHLKATLKVIAEPKAACFEVLLEASQHWSDFKEFWDGDDIRVAREVIEFLLTISGLSLGSLLAILKIRKDNLGKIAISKDGKLVQEHRDANGSTIPVAPEVQSLLMNKKALNATERFLSPLRSNKGITKITGHSAHGPLFSITTEEERSIIYEPIASKDEDKEKTYDVETVILKPYAPVYDSDAPKWRFWLNNEHYYMDISDSDLPAIITRYGGALIEDKIVADIQIKASPSGKKEYKVIEVHKFIPAPRQSELSL